MLVVRNTSGSSRVITTLAGQDETSKEGFGTLDKKNNNTTIKAGETKYIGPFSYSLTDVNGEVFFTYDSAVGLEVVAVRLPLPIQDVIPSQFCPFLTLVNFNLSGTPTVNIINNTVTVIGTDFQQAEQVGSRMP